MTDSETNVESSQNPLIIKPEIKETETIKPIMNSNNNENEEEKSMNI